MILTGKKYENESISTTIPIRDNGFTDFDVINAERPYLLREVEFERIVNGDPKIVTIVIGFAIASVGYFLAFLSKWFGMYFNENVKILKSDYAMLAFVIVATVILYIISSRMSNPKKETIKIIKDHFKNAKNEIGLRGGNS